ncbi:MAG: hypothetical protein O7C55_07130, partial [Rickettsia endosymbiont of Ixodes persulcatus]|nr:hypothetical protein [Rickettsia endosymbiont of Ixodes persulcatus]
LTQDSAIEKLIKVNSGRGATIQWHAVDIIALSQNGIPQIIGYSKGAAINRGIFCGSLLTYTQVCSVTILEKPRFLTHPR